VLSSYVAVEAQRISISEGRHGRRHWNERESELIYHRNPGKGGISDLLAT